MTEPAQFPTTQPRPAPDPPSGGNGNGVRGRLRALEVSVAELKAKMASLATREDIQTETKSLLKWGVGILAAVIIGLFSASALLVARLISS